MLPLLLALSVAPTGGLIQAQPFTLQACYPNAWSPKAAPICAGLLVVIATDPRPVSQVNEPTLMAGATPVERLSWSNVDPYVVAVIPGPVDLAHTPLYWAEAGLPERLSPAAAADLAKEAAALPMPKVQPLGPTLDLADQAALYAAAGRLMERYTPADAARAAPWLRAGR